MKKTIYLLFLFSACTLAAHAQRWSYDTLSEKKVSMNIAVNGNKIFFHSGSKKIGSSTVKVTQTDIFDVQTGKRTTVPLPTGSLGRTLGATAVVGSKVLFAGGFASSNLVDIYDTLTNTWSTTNLSLDRYYLAGIGAGGRAFFAGGNSGSINNETNKVDIYNVGTGVWTSTILPWFGAQRLTAASVGDKILFAGGDYTNSYYYNTVTIYNTNTNQWLPNAILSQYKTGLTSLVYNDKVYFVGGNAEDKDTNLKYPSDTIDIYDNATGTWSTMKIPRLMDRHLGGKRAYIQSAQAGCKMFLVPTPNPRGGNGVFIPGFADTIAVYDFARSTWSYLPLPHPRTQVSIAAAKNKVYFAGGADVWTMEWLNHIDILTLEPKLQLAVDNIPSTQYDFGKVVTGEEKTIIARLSNEGDYDLLFSTMPHRITVSGDTEDFTIDKSAIESVDTLSPAQVINLPVVFSPLTTGTKQLAITIYSDDPENPIYTYTLKGEGDDAVTSVKNSISTAFKIYPNPATDLVQIESTANEAIYLQVANSQGMVIKDKVLLKDTFIDMSAFSTGLYFFKFSNEKFTEVMKVVKK